MLPGHGGAKAGADPQRRREGDGPVSSKSPDGELEDLSAVLRNAVCACFAQNWREGRQPRIEDYLDGPEGPDQPALLRALLILELKFRVATGEQVTAEEYRQRFPLYPEVLASAMEALNASELD